MKITGHKPKNRWHPPTFTIRGIDRDTLSLILSFAKDGIEKYESNGDFSKYLKMIRIIDDFINGDAEVIYNPLEIDTHNLPEDSPKENET